MADTQSTDTEAPPRPLDGTGILAGSCATSRTDSAVTIAAWRIDAATGEKTIVHVALSADGARLFAKQVSEWADHVDKLNGPPTARLMRYVMDAAEEWRAAEPQAAEQKPPAENSNEPPVRRAEGIATVEQRRRNKERTALIHRARKAKRR